MNIPNRQLDVNLGLEGLKDFQKKTVNYVFKCLYKGNGRARFLIADEVGLGKTLVARGIIAKAVDHLRSENKKMRIDIVYICSNQSIARQNIDRINIIDNDESALADRMTLLPLSKVKDNKLNFVAFTPGTSFDLRSSGGVANERALIYHILKKGWKLGNVAGPMNLFQCSMDKENWRLLLSDFPKYDKALAQAFLTRLKGSGIRKRFNRLVKEFPRNRNYSNIPSDLQRERYKIIGELRTVLAESCIKALEPDIVILDEFQRFRDLLNEEEEMGRLAKMVLNYPSVKVILLSATPYKMYTMYNEMQNEDHYTDFLKTVEFLFRSKKRTGEFKSDLVRYRNALLQKNSPDIQELNKVKRRIESKLRKVMVRTERITSSIDQTCMISEAETTLGRLEPEDLKAFSIIDKVAGQLGAGDTVEYWKSAPYLLNVMDREGYKIKKEFIRLIKSQSALPILGILREDSDDLLSWKKIRKYSPIHPPNARLRDLISRKVQADAWKLLWIPPCMPYYRATKGPYSEPILQDFTKALVFSSWLVVPKVIAMLTSYEAERQMVTQFDHNADYFMERKRHPPLLRFAFSDNRPTGMPIFTLIYPCITLAAQIDPLQVAKKSAKASGLIRTEDMIRNVESSLHDLLDPILAPYKGMSGPTDEHWYYAALTLLDWYYYRKPVQDWLESKDTKFAWTSMVRGGNEEDSNFAEHVEILKSQFNTQGKLGRPPEDLLPMLASIALASPAIVTLRSLLRILKTSDILTSGKWLLSAAAKVGMGFRRLFNLPESMALIRSPKPDEDVSYWKRTIDYCVDGNLQSVMDEYVHVLRESLGVLQRPPNEAIPKIAEEIQEAVSIRTVNLDFDEIIPDRSTGDLSLDKHSIRCRFALRFGDGKSEEEKAEIRKDQVRTAFNSPFRPFILATTSIGQEGLDFHQYCHEIYHWNLPSNPVDLEQREGRINRYKGHVIRRNVANLFSESLFQGSDGGFQNPWDELFMMARNFRDDRYNDLVPYWIFEPSGGKKINRYIPILPLSRDYAHLENLSKTLVAYRMVMGQPRQEDLLCYLQQRFEEDLDPSEFLKYRINLSPR